MRTLANPYKYRAQITNMLKSKLVKNSSITLISFAFEFTLRLGSSLILTRLLFPEAYGLMGIVYSVILGIALISDVGIKNAIIQRNKKHLTPNFVDTVWTLQIVRGGCIFAVVSLLAYPFSVFYGQDTLCLVLMVHAFSEVIRSCHSISVYLRERELDIRGPTIIKMLSAFLGTTITIIAAYISPSVWALVIGGYVNALVYAVSTHYFLDGEFKHKFHFNRQYVTEIVNFGKWLMLSGFLGFLVNQADKLVVGKIFSIEFLGLFVLATTLALIPRNILYALFGKVLYPLYSKLQRESATGFRSKIAIYRFAIAGVTLVPSLIFIGFGDLIISFAYDERYLYAGQLLQILSVGVALEVCLHAGPIFMSINKPKIFTLLVAIKGFTLIFSMLIANAFFGVEYVIYGVIFSPIGFYLAQSYFLIKENLWMWRTDFVLTLFVICYCSIIYVVR